MSALHCEALLKGALVESSEYEVVIGRSSRSPRTTVEKLTSFTRRASSFLILITTLDDGHTERHAAL